MNLVHFVRRALRRIGREDILMLALAVGAGWSATEGLYRVIATSHQVTPFATRLVVHATLALAILVLWLAWGRRVRLWLEHHWPRAWSSIESVAEFLIHTPLELAYKLLSSRGANPPTRVRYPLTVTFPASLRDKRDANRIARTEWGGDTPNLFADFEWHRRNPNTMGIARDSAGAAVGYFDFAPVSTKFLAQLRTGVVNEFDLADLILPDDDSCTSLRRAEVVYVAGIVAYPFKSTRDRQKIGAFLHWSMARILCESVFGKDEARRVLFVAVAYGGDGSDGATFCERVKMTKVGHVVVDGDPTAEKHTWYQLETSLAELKQRNARLRRILKGEYGPRWHVDVRESTVTKQIYVLDKPSERSASP